MATTWSPAAWVRTQSQTRTRLAGIRSLPWLAVAMPVGVLCLWQLASVTGALPETSLPSAWEVLHEWASMVVTMPYWTGVWDTLSSALLGLVFVIPIGLVVGMLIGRVRFARESSWLLIEFLKPIPPVAMIPLALLLWGPTSTMKLILITFGALWPFLTQLVYGMSQVDTAALKMSRSYRLGAWLTGTRVILPSLLPFATTGIRVSASIAIIVSVVTELVGGANGLGRDIVLAQSANQLPEVYALILTTGVLGILVNTAFALAEKPLLFWHPTHRSNADK